LRARRGSIGLALIAIFVTLLLFSFCLASSLNHYQFSSALDQRARARDQAESLIHLAIAELCRNPAWAQTLRQSDQNGMWEVSGGLSFDPVTAHKMHIPHCTNNLEGGSSKAGDGQRVPRAGCHLAVLGKCGSQRVQIETIFVRPPFPTGCAAQGPVELRGVRLWGLQPETGMPEPPNPDPWAPANVFTNCPAGDALKIDGASEIFGNAVAAGGIRLDPGSVVRGEVYPGSQRRPMANFDIPSMWNDVKAYVGVIPFAPGRKLGTFCVIDGSLNVAGDLELDGGTLAVNGDLTVSGKLSGRGFVLVTGNVDTQSGADLEADHRLALLCGGDLKLRGTGQEHVFSGLLYSRGDVDAHDLTVMGALVADGATGTETVLLDRVNLVSAEIGVRGNVGKPYNTGLNKVKGFPRKHTGGPKKQDEPIILSMQSYSDPDDPGQKLYSGMLEVNEGDILHDGPGWGEEDQKDRGWRITFSAPNAYLQSGHRVRPWQLSLQPVKTVPYNGTKSDALRITREWLHTGTSGQSAPFHEAVKGVTALDEYLKLLDKPEANAISWNLDLNNLLPQIELTRILTWREGAPSR
jgi:hypothetical protein